MAGCGGEVTGRRPEGANLPATLAPFGNSTFPFTSECAMPSSEHLIWIDLEMTGLKPDADVIIEIATVVTDRNLEVIAEGPNLAIHQPDEALAGMDEWNTRQHGASGLTARVKASPITTAMAEERTLAFLAPLVTAGASPMCGNSICQDRRFLARHMPQLERFFHYRNLDVSTLKELARRWAPSVSESFAKTGAHLALADIHESIRELRHYRANLLAPQFRGMG
jgi:oligoribonuclease